MHKYSLCEFMANASCFRCGADSETCVVSIVVTLSVLVVQLRALWVP